MDDAEVHSDAQARAAETGQEHLLDEQTLGSASAAVSEHSASLSTQNGQPRSSREEAAASSRSYHILNMPDEILNLIFGAVRGGSQRTNSCSEGSSDDDGRQVCENVVQPT